MSHENSSSLLLGKATEYVSHYDPNILFPIARQEARNSLSISASALPFTGKDCWTAYELSWLDQQGKPQVRLAEFFFDCNSPAIIESKSFKLYLNSFNQSRFESEQQVKT